MLNALLAKISPYLGAIAGACFAAMVAMGWLLLKAHEAKGEVQADLDNAEAKIQELVLQADEVARQHQEDIDALEAGIAGYKARADQAERTLSGLESSLTTAGENDADLNTCLDTVLPTDTIGSLP